MKQELVFLFDSVLMRDENYILGRTLTIQTILFIICFNDSSLKMMKMHLHHQALFVLKIFKFLS